MEIHGATPAEWDHFAGKLNLRQDLLPVVSDPSAEISEFSRMKDKGKTPSIFNRDGKVVGMPQWTALNADDGDVRRWSRDNRLGICIQTRLARAIDIDVADPAMADAIEQAVRDAVPGVRWSTRWRENSGKRLMPFIFEGELYKRSFPIGTERVELLAYGQQFIAKGRHPSGVHYQWRGGLPDGFPVLTAEEVENLWDTLEMLFATGEGYRARTPREGAGNGSTAGEGTDRVLAYLAELGLILDHGPSDQAYIECPWAGEHSSDNGVTQTAYFPAGTGGYARGHFKCMHDHCAGRTDAEFMEALGYEPEGAGDDDFEDLTRSPGSVTIDGEAATRAVVIRPLPGVPGLEDGPAIDMAVAGEGVLPDYRRLVEPLPLKRDKAGAIVSTAANVTLAMGCPEFCTRKIRYDEFKNTIVWAGWNEADTAEVWREWQDVDLNRALVTLDRRNFKTTPAERLVKGAIADIAARNPIDSGIKWLSSLPPWDGIPRVETFFVDYMGAEDAAYTRAVGRYLWTALAGRMLFPGIQVDMAPILVGAQGVGKSRTVRAIAPDPEWAGELDLGIKDAERGRLIAGKVIVELGELRGLANAQLEDIKSFVPRPYDEWRPLYAEKTRKTYRRAVFIGTTNSDEFLGDDTGERRWLPVEVSRSDVEGVEADREQLWAEGLALFNVNGVEWSDAQNLAPEVQQKFKIVDDWESDITRWLHDGGVGGVPPIEIGWFTASELFAGAFNREHGLVSSQDSKRLGRILRKTGWKRGTQRIGGVPTTVWKLREAI